MSKGKTVQTQQATVPKYQEDYYKKVYARSEAESNNPYQEYQGQAIADRNQAQTTAYDNVLNQSPQLQNANAIGGMQGLIGQNANVQNTNVNPTSGFTGETADRQNVREVTPQMIMGTLGNYMNPYTQVNIDQGVKDLNRSRLTQLMSDQDQSIGSGAFGGSRSALLEAETNKNYNESVADFVDKKREDAFNQATNLATQEINRNMTADQFNAGQDANFELANQQAMQNAGLQDQNLNQAFNFKNAELDQQRNLANAQNMNATTDRDMGIYQDILGQQNANINQLAQQGMFQNQYDQSLLDYDRKVFNDKNNQGLKNLGILQSGLSGISPLIGNTNSTQKKTGMGDILGAGLQVASLFSDSRLKKAIKFLFKLPNGIKIYSWEWNEKADELDIPENYTVGVLAQEVMHIPNAVIQDESGYLKVNYEVL